MFEFDDRPRLSCSLHSPIGEQPLLSLLALENGAIILGGRHLPIGEHSLIGKPMLSLLALENGAIILGGRHLPAGNWRSGHIQQKQMDLPPTLKRCCYYIEGEENFRILYLAFLHFVFYISSFCIFEFYSSILLLQP